jgi:hypothetical protein
VNNGVRLWYRWPRFGSTIHYEFEIPGLEALGLDTTRRKRGVAFAPMMPCCCRCQIPLIFVARRLPRSNDRQRYRDHDIIFIEPSVF